MRQKDTEGGKTYCASKAWLTLDYAERAVCVRKVHFYDRGFINRGMFRAPEKAESSAAKLLIFKTKQFVD